MSALDCHRASDDDVARLASLRYTWRVEERGERGLGATEFESQLREWMHRHRDSHLGYLAVEEDVAVGCAWLCVVDRIPVLARSSAVQARCKVCTCVRRVETRAWALRSFASW